MRSARPAERLSRSAESGAPFRKIAARKLRGFRAPVVQLSWRGLRYFQRLQQHHRDHQRDDQARGQVRGVVRRRVEVGIPALRRDGGEEDHTREKVACEARQNGHCGAKDGASHCGLEESCEAKGAEGQRVIQEELYGMYHERIDDEIQHTVNRSRDEAHLPALPEGEEYKRDHLQGDRAPKGHLEEHDESENKRQGDGERRLGQYPGVSEGIQLRILLPVYGDAPIRDSEISLRRHYPDQVQRVGASAPSQPHGSPDLLCSQCNLPPAPAPPALQSNPSTVAASVIPPSETLCKASPNGNSTTLMNSVGSGLGPRSSLTAAHPKRWQTSVLRPVLVCTEARCSNLSAL